MSYYHNYPSSCPIILSISLFLRHIEDSSNTSFSSQHASSSSSDQQQQQQHDHNIHRHHKGEQQQISSSPHYQAANNNTLRQLPDTSWLAQQAQQTEGGSKVCSLHLWNHLSCSVHALVVRWNQSVHVLSVSNQFLWNATVHLEMIGKKSLNGCPENSMVVPNMQINWKRKVVLLYTQYCY